MRRRALLLLTAALAAAYVCAGEVPMPGVANTRRAWQNWTLNCQGCHRPDASGSAGTTPALAGSVSEFLSVPGGREYLSRVPGVATSPLSDAELSEVLNWILWRFDKDHVPGGFMPFRADEVGRLRTQPLRLEASRVRAELLASIKAAERPPLAPESSSRGRNNSGNPH